GADVYHQPHHRQSQGGACRAGDAGGEGGFVSSVRIAVRPRSVNGDRGPDRVAVVEAPRGSHWDTNAAVAPVGSNIGIAVDGAPRPVVVVRVVKAPIVRDFPARPLPEDAICTAGRAGRNPALETLAEIELPARCRDRQ